ncbi:MBL fold metallo-hydrolase [Mucisphaera calidilacus]|uniref:N-acyl homoserine lactonase n=1 Tax=Mucisphaera calidilacus TaxID=2527982 RepID=A0A518BTU4_9BACT|nr:MBL fold metallo-hydrolase [Mucisphaera calidilacus]QDU70400.1 N-acyl homoserine lactonase [Mucisphaera calidilacus]
MNNKHDAISRRDVFRLGLTASATLGLASLAHAQDAEPQPQADPATQGAGFYRFNLGELEIAVIADGTFQAPAATFAANQTEETAAAEARKHFADPEAMTCHVNGLIVRSTDTVTLIDTGCGANFGPTLGKTPDNLTRFGIRPEDVSTVVFTHLHIDHCGGVVGEHDASLYPNAEFVTTQAERDFWTQNPDLSKTGIPANTRDYLINIAQQAATNTADRTRIIQPGKEIVPGITSVDLPGHTPGHIGVMLDSRGETLFFVTDAIHNAKIQMANPTWHVAFDTDPVQAAKMRQRALDRAAVEKLMIAGSHLPFPAVGHVRPLGGGYEWEPVAWAWN